MSKFLILALALGMSALTGCAQHVVQNSAHTTVFSNFASMAPSNTELIYALNAQDQLIAVCDQCDYPAAAKSKKQLGSFVSVNPEKLVQIHPQGIFLVEEQGAIANTIRKQNIETVLLRNSTVADVASNLRTIGKCTGKEVLADKLAGNFERSVAEISKKASASRSRPKVFMCIWPEPLITVGQASYLNDAVTVCGGENLAGKMAAAYPHFSGETLLMQQPDIIILPDEAHNQTFLDRAPWTSLEAVKAKKVFYLPPRDADRLSRPTLRLVDGLRWLAKVIHPELFS